MSSLVLGQLWLDIVRLDLQGAEACHPDYASCGGAIFSLLYVSANVMDAIGSGSGVLIIVTVIYS